MKIILPLPKPIITGFPSTSTSLSILQHHEEALPWIFNNYIQIFSASPDTNIDFFDINIDNCPFLITSVLDKQFIQECGTILDFIITALRCGYYVTCMVNTEKLSAYTSHMGYHDPLFYGYDDDKKEFYFAEYIHNGAYGKAYCTFDEFNDAVLLPELDSVDQDFLTEYETVKLIKYDGSWFQYKIKLDDEYRKRFDFLPQRVKQSFEDYIFGRITTNWFTRIPYLNDREKDCHYFGMDCYDLLRLQLNENWEIGYMPSGMRQSYYVMYTHKMMQQYRIQYMQQNGYLQNGKKHLEIWEELTKRMHQILLCVLKENSKGQFHTPRKRELLLYIDQLKEKETDAIRKFLKDMV